MCWGTGFFTGLGWQDNGQEHRIGVARKGGWGAREVSPVVWEVREILADLGKRVGSDLTNRRRAIANLTKLNLALRQSCGAPSSKGGTSCSGGSASGCRIREGCRVRVVSVGPM